MIYTGQIHVANVARNGALLDAYYIKLGDEWAPLPFTASCDWERVRDHLRERYTAQIVFNHEFPVDR